MDNMEVADDYQEVKDQVAILNARGEAVTEDQVVERTLRRGLEQIMEYRMDNTYYSVKWNDQKELDIYDMYSDLVGTIKPKGENFVDDFKKNDQGVWDYFNDELKTLITR
ncbi:hypothetical protein [Fructobacillus ficulneus]|uniref:Uncharacterized protein n=1 Tax=Fructobacillus ficulneus TaxID=157463 RepID=A0A0K8MFE2_9LACO|nr:hypothetical protein [Fructobacillus ficulneus]GAO99207.1 hypothetical protein FFIC_090300 [Fructobacillus ficulneus]